MTANPLQFDEAEYRKMTKVAPGDPRTAEGLERVLSNMTSNLQFHERKLASLSREVVECLGNLKRAETSQKKLCGNQMIDRRVELLRESLQDLQRQESLSERQVKAHKDGIAKFLAQGPEGSPTNGEMITAARELERSMQEAGL